MSLFKILGVRALSGCSMNILKNLEVEKFYRFYNNYDFVDNYVVEKVQCNVPDNFFAPNISIHALVGVNGSGKSSIIELMIRIINNLYFNYQPSESSISFEKTLQIRYLEAELYFLHDDKILKVYVKDGYVELTDKEGNNYLNTKKDLQRYFFYTIVTNYSHYAYNSSYLYTEALKGKKDWTWIDALFHKNDGYTTPIVLNPFRKNGNIDVNSETYLSTQRLMAFFTYFKLNGEQFHPEYELYSYEMKLDSKGLKEKLNKAKTYYFPIIQKTAGCSYEEAEKHIKRNWKDLLPAISCKYETECWMYIIYKTISIICKYPFYTSYFKENTSREEPFMETIKKIDSDRSHISMKLIQTINFMRNPRFDIGAVRWNDIEKKIKRGKLSHSLSLKSIMDILPPPIFATKFFLSYKTKAGRIAKVNINSLSSGEIQMLYSLSSTLYHLHNLDSIDDYERIQYRKIQLIFEEIELYYHPEYQRKYISTIIRYIQKLKLKTDICIDILVVTHSPFVVSDIPKENILFLKRGNPFDDPQEMNNTFGANYYDLLHNNFFITESAYGDFANNKIGEIANKVREGKEITEIDKKVISLIGDNFLRSIIEDNM